MSGAGARADAYRVVGVIHLPALPGSALGGPASAFDALLAHARRDAEAYAAGGADALMVENFHDVPFRRDSVEPHTVAAMTLAVDAIRRAVGLPVGVNVLRNDVLSAVGIAAVTGAGFVRANVYVGATLTDQGLIEGRAHEVQGLVRRLGAPVAVWADVDVKHAAPVARRPIGEEAEDAVERGLAAALVVSGAATGKPTSLDDLRSVRDRLPQTPIYVGSGTTAERVPDLLSVADGVIVGTWAKVDGVVTNPVDPERVRRLAEAARR